MTTRLPAHAHVHAVAVAVAATVGGAVVLGGTGCGVPFEVTRSASIVLPLGAADPACSTTSETRVIAGRDVTFDRHLADEAAVDATGAPAQGCELVSTATGPFLDLASVKKQAGAAADGTHIDGVSIEVARVTLQNIDASRVHTLHARVDIAGQANVVVIDGVPPAGTSHVSEALVHALDDAWQKAASVNGTGHTDVVEDAGVTAAPALAIDLQIHVQGTASLGG